MWALLDRPDAVVHLKDDGRLRWNETTQRWLRYSNKVDVLFDSTNQLIGIRPGTVFPVFPQSAGEYRVELGEESITTMGLSFSGDKKLTPTVAVQIPGEPEPPDGLLTVPYPE